MQDLVVVGAGITGLTAAWELQARGLRPLVLERSARAGGVVLTETHGGFVIDAGPDSLLVQKPAAVELCRALGIADRLVPTLEPRTAFVLRNKSLVPLPEASVLGLPTRVGPFLTTGLFSWPAKLRMAAEVLIAAKRDLPDESIASFMRRRFGEEAVTVLAEPLLAGIHVGDVEQLSIHALFPKLVEAERVNGSVLRALAASSRTPRAAHGAFVSFPGGMTELVDALVCAVGEPAIRRDAAVVKIAGRQPFTITLESGEAIDARSVIVTTPAWEAATVLPSVDRDLAALCGGIPYASSATVAYGMRREQVRHPLSGSGFVVPRSEGRHVLAATWVSSKWPHRARSGDVLIRGFLGGARDAAVLAMSDSQLAMLAFGELASILDIAGAPSLTQVYRWARSTPQYIVGHQARIRAIDDRLSQIPGLYLVGSGYRGTGIPDCVADARATAARAAKALSDRY